MPEQNVGRTGPHLGAGTAKLQPRPAVPSNFNHGFQQAFHDRAQTLEASLYALDLSGHYCIELSEAARVHVDITPFEEDCAAEAVGHKRTVSTEVCGRHTKPRGASRTCFGV